MKKKVVDPRYAKGGKYRRVINEINRVGKCPFCPKNFTYHDKPILKDRKRWFLTYNFNPYPGSRYHFLLIRKRHAEKLRHLKPQDFVDVLWLLKWLERRFKLQGGGVAMRFGKTHYTGASVCHMHCHVIVPKLEYRTIKGRRQRVACVVNFPIG